MHRALELVRRGKLPDTRWDDFQVTPPLSERHNVPGLLSHSGKSLLVNGLPLLA
jgi:hypothetical protein